LSELLQDFNLSLIALRQLHNDRGFMDISFEKIRQEYEQKSNTVKAFLHERCLVDLTDSEYSSLTADVHDEYRKFCKERNERSLEKHLFGIKLAEQGIEKKRIRLYNGQRGYAYIGIKLLS
jgi:phage/plasmid-associated DNA primase